MRITPKDIMDWAASPRGKMVLTIVAALIGAGIFAYYFGIKGEPPPGQAQGKGGKAPTLFLEESHGTGVNYDMINETKEEKKPEQPKTQPTPTIPARTAEARMPTAPRQAIQALPIVNIFTKPRDKSVDLADRFAPYGRLISCQLVLTIDSAFAETPVVALTTENLWHQGKLVIPAGAEVHGKAIAKPVRDRVMTEKEWVVVWRTRDDDNGKELRLKGLALTKEQMLAGDSWHLHDGSAGIRGEVIKSSEMQELMAYAAEFIATFTDNLTQESVTITDWGQTTTKSGDVKDAVNEGVASAVRKYADRLMEQIENEGYFVRCAGGTVFYLYITDIVNMNEAEIAGTRVPTKR